MNFKKTRILLLISFFLALIFTHNILAQSTVKLFGRVFDDQAGKPLYRANVVIEGTGFGASTDERGYFQIENLIEGIYTVTASYIGYGMQRFTDIRVPKDQPVQLNFRLTPEALPMREIKVFAEHYKKNPAGDVKIITKKDIELSNVQSLGEILGHVSGVEVQSTGGVGSSKKISIRGSQTNQVLVLLDGIPLNDELSGDIDLSGIPVNIIEKVEVFMGGNSPRFGSGAIGGVVNIITKKTFTNQIQLNSSYGSFQFFTIEPNLSGKYKKLSYFLSYNYIKSKGNFPYHYENSQGETTHENRINEDMISQNLFARLNYEWKGYQVSVQAQRMESDRGIPGKINAWTAYARSKNTRDIIGTEYKINSQKITFTLSGRYSNTITENSNLYPADAEKRFRRYSKYHYQYAIKNFIISSNFEYVPTNWFHLTTGYIGRRLNYRDENFRASLNPPINEANDVSHSFFIHQEWKANMPWHFTQIVFTPAIRYDEMNIDSDEQNRFDHQWSPGAGLFLSLGETYKFYLKSNISRSFRVPTFADMFYQDVRIEGKPDLLPEKSRNIDIGLGWQFTAWGLFSGEITSFKYTIDDLIVWKLGSFEVFRPFNTNAEISGQEYSLECRTPNDLIALELGYTYLKPLYKNDNKTTHDKIITYRPQESFKASLHINYGAWKSVLRYRNVGKRFVTEANTVEMPPYLVLDLNISLALHVGALESIWKFSVFNLTNEKYEIIRDYPLPGREWRLGLSLIY